MSERVCAAKCVELRGGRGIIHAMFETHTVEGNRPEDSAVALRQDRVFSLLMAHLLILEQHPKLLDTT